MKKRIDRPYSSMCPQCGKNIIFFTNYLIRTDDIEYAKFYKCVACGSYGKIKKQLTLDEENFIKDKKHL